MRKLLLVIALCALPVGVWAFGWGSGGTSTTVPRVCTDGQIPVFATSTGKWACGDPDTGEAKARSCTVAGTPGTWVSEGNL